MTEFAYNNIKNTSIGYMPFEFNYGYHQRVSYKEDINSHSRSKIANELTKKLRDLIAVYRENLQHA